MSATDAGMWSQSNQKWDMSSQTSTSRRQWTEKRTGSPALYQMWDGCGGLGLKGDEQVMCYGGPICLTLADYTELCPAILGRYGPNI